MKSRIFAINNAQSIGQELIGDGNKHVLILIRNEEAQEKTIEDLLKAIKLDSSLDVFKLIISPESKIDLSSILADRAITRVVSFGLSPVDIGYNINHAYYHVYEFSNHKLILSESIRELNSDKNKKIALWKTLQEVFL